MKKLLNIRVSLETLFIIESILFIVALFIIYGYRLVHFYLIENPKPKENMSMAEAITSRNTTIYGEGLYSLNEGYIYKGKNVNNYVYYSNRLWRIIRINPDNTITMITDDLQTSLVWGYNSNYKDSYVKEWLNKSNNNNSGIFESTLVNTEYLSNTNLCTDVIVNLDDLTCGNVITSKVGLMSIKDYMDAGAENSYLNKGFYEWTTNISVDNRIWFITSDGSISDGSFNEENYFSFGVRPVITLNKGVKLKGGIGSIDNPYQISGDQTNYEVGKYITYNNYLWKIIGIKDTTLKVVMNEELLIDDEYFTVENSKNDIIFNPKIKNSIAYYLNNTFYNKLLNKDYIIESSFNVGEYNLSKKYDYKNIFNKQVNAKVGLLSISDLDLNNYDNEYTLTPFDIVAETIYVTSSKGLLTKDGIDNAKSVRPVINLDKTLNIISGDGSITSPYEIGR